jgi:hypothetical protein
MSRAPLAVVACHLDGASASSRSTASIECARMSVRAVWPPPPSTPVAATAEPMDSMHEPTLSELARASVDARAYQLRRKSRASVPATSMTRRPFSQPGFSLLFGEAVSPARETG